MNRLFDFIVALGDLFMPRACLACGCRLGMRERHLCLSCAADVPYTRFWLAPHNPLADRFNAVLERHRGTEPMDYAYAAALLYYKGAYRSIPRALKYQGDLAAGRHYGALLGRRLAAAPAATTRPKSSPAPWSTPSAPPPPLVPPPRPLLPYPRDARSQPAMTKEPPPSPSFRAPLRPSFRA